MTKENKIPVSYHLLYFLLAAAVVYFYYIKIVYQTDLNFFNSINAVQSFESRKPYQFRLLVPFIFFLFKPLEFIISQREIITGFFVIVVYLTVVVYQKILAQYFQNKKAVLFLAPVILYPILWNYVILNQGYQFYDFMAILIFITGLYFIIKDNFTGLLVTFGAGIFNKETAGYLVFAYLLFNYKIVFTKKIIINTFLLTAVFFAIKLPLGYIFRNNPGDPVELCMNENINIIKNIFSNYVYLKNVVLNFGGLYIFIFLLFLSRRWKHFPSRKLLFINLAFSPNILLGFFVTCYSEVRVYAEFVPLITTLFLIYLSTFKKFNLQPAEKT
ncbi:MAG TPA: hypothetical protein VGK25_14125 [Ignavibacteria bacterium]